MAFNDNVTTKSFLLHNEAKRLHINDTDLTTTRISAIFQVRADGLYLEDDISRETFFPTLNVFPISTMRDKGSFAVCGTPNVTTENTFPYFGAAGHGLSSPSWSSGSGQAGPSSSLRPTHGGFQHPVNARKTKTLRKQVLVADLNDGELRVYTSVHVNITENMGVREISESVKEILNTEEEYTICDSKGIELTDSQETRALEFWKTPNRKVHAVKSSDLQLPRLHKTKRKRSNAMRDHLDNENCPTKMEDLLETLETNTKLEVQNMKDTLKDAIADNAEEIMTSLNQVKTSLSNVNTKLENLDERVVDVKIETYVTSALRDILRCKVCTQVPRNTVIVAACCGQVLGCGECVQKCISENEFCILCKNPSVVDKIVPLKGFQMVLDKFQSV